ncbi:MAG: hypothetical protein JXR66_12145 [Bacteroidales bacterium]|nr:hypothetical protein [Bacteroidales bacterium]
MKKIITSLVLLLLLTCGCEEEKMKLSGFIIGEWDSELTAINLGSEDQVLVYFYAIFRTDNTFDLDFLSYPEKVALYSFDNLNYSINGEFSITIDNPMEAGVTVDFEVVWNPGLDKMVWVPVPDPDDNPPVIPFTRR